MRYLSFDIEATGLDENDLIIEFAMIPFDTSTGELNHELSKHYFVECPSFEFLAPNLNPWVAQHNEGLIRKAHEEGISLQGFKEELKGYLELPEVKNYFKRELGGKIILFGKSMNAIDLPFLTRDLGWNFMRKYFHHRVLDLSCVSYNLIDMGLLPPKCESGSELMKYLGMGEVCHTALEDAVNTAKMYIKLLEKFGSN